MTDLTDFKTYKEFCRREYNRWDEPAKRTAHQVLTFLYGDRQTWIVDEYQQDFDLMHYANGVQYEIEVGVKTKWLDRPFGFTTVHVEMRKAKNPRKDKLLMYINNPLLSKRINFVILPSLYVLGAEEVIINTSNNGREKFKDVPVDLPQVKIQYTPCGSHYEWETSKSSKKRSLSQESG